MLDVLNLVVVAMNDKELKKEKFRDGCHSAHSSGFYRNTPKIRCDYPNIYFRRLGKIEILKQLEDFENEIYTTVFR